VELNYIAFAVPLFFLGILVEVTRDRSVYRFADALADLSSGVFQQVTVVFANLLLLGGYVWLFERHRLYTFHGMAAWLFAIVAVDFIYYWWHRLSHEVNFLWAAHVVHHSSEDYNLAVALRQSIFTEFTSWPLFALLALAGVPPVIYFTVHSFNTLYQFWIHTRLIGKLGPLEKWINTPSLHRVHHAINPRYLDKNYGGTFMIWDRLFGTYEPETEPCVYGIVKPLGSFDVFRVQIHYYVECARISWQAPHLIDKLRVWWAPPTWSARGLPQKPPPPEVSPETFVKWAPQGGTGFRLSWLLQMAPVLVATFFFMLLGARLPLLPRVGAAAAILFALWSIGASLEGRTSYVLRSAACVAFLLLSHS
jgi:sterol desaturase/sphingolipid hydroxylase (fatty acid hydroxylase superfamily)